MTTCKGPRRDDASYVLSDDLQGVVTDTTGLANAAMAVNGNDRQAAAKWLRRQIYENNVMMMAVVESLEEE